MTSISLPLENVVDEIASQAAGHSPSGSVTSMESSASKSLNLDPAHHHYPKPQINFVRAAPWRIQSKHYKDIQIRTHSSFVQIILSPSSTGLRHSINSNVCEELVDCTLFLFWKHGSVCDPEKNQIKNMDLKKARVIGIQKRRGSLASTLFD